MAQFIVIPPTNETVTPGQEAKAQQMVTSLCKAPMIDSGEQLAMLQRIVQRFRPNPLFRLNKVSIVLVNSPAVNAGTIIQASHHNSVICLDSGLMAAMGDSEAEVAAVIAHELGHAFDLVCGQYIGIEARQKPTNELRRTCEARADDVGFKTLVAAGYNPFAMAGAFGRLEAFAGDTRTNLLARLLNTLTSDHPITPDRIQAVHKMIGEYFCHENPAACR